ncbi:unnamed protein product [Closterium sp. Naga37s-1]|nr:unnamed protein product [Closterium sp. Naga37s-1]
MSEHFVVIRTCMHACRYPVIQPDTKHTKLKVSQEGLSVIRSIKNPIAIVAVIGPYRSGKSFLLNQLLTLTCDEGFGVGHARDTKTKGIWVWGDPMEMQVNGQTTSLTDSLESTQKAGEGERAGHVVAFLDIEGFESVGKSSVYDDRIFALATVLSSVLIYNLAETVKEADIAKLSFAVELAEEFYGRWVEVGVGDGVGWVVGEGKGGRDEVFTPAKLLWLIQRDFLEGKTVQEMVRGALQPVPNPEGDKDVDQVNLIRQSLNLMAANSTAFGLTQDVDQVNLIRQSLNGMTVNSTAFVLTEPHLARTRPRELSDDELHPKYVPHHNQSLSCGHSFPPPPSLLPHPIHQPHLARTRLCELSDDELDPKYVRQRNQLRQLVASLVQPKIVSGRPVTGEEFADLLEKTLSALNKGHIPTAGSVVDAFNRAVQDKCLALYHDTMKRLLPFLPAEEAVLLAAHRNASGDALGAFERERFGGKSVEDAVRPLKDELREELVKLKRENEFGSAKACEGAHRGCEEELDALANMRLPCHQRVSPCELVKLKRENEFASAKACEGAHRGCEEELDALANMRLPSVAKFDARLEACNHTVEHACRGPSKSAYRDRLKKTWTRERSQFLKEYNQRLFNWLVIGSLVLVVVGRFMVKWVVVEVLAWALFVFLETYTRIFWSFDSLYLNPAWRTFVNIWEAVVYNPFIDLDLWSVPLLWVLLILIIMCRCYRCRKRPHTPLLPTHHDTLHTRRSE